MSQRKMWYAEAEGSYTDILYAHILGDKVFPENDGVIKEVKVERRRVDLVSRYGQPERYFAIEIKYFPVAFEQGFQQAQGIKSEFHAVFLGVPSEDVPVAQEVRGKEVYGRRYFTNFKNFPTRVAAAKARLNPNPSQKTIKLLRRHFESVLYGEHYSRTYYEKIWDTIKSKLTKRRSLAFLILFLSQTQVYSLQKFLSHRKIKDFGTKLSKELNIKVKHPDWSCWELYPSA